VSEEKEGSESGQENVSAVADPAAIALALGSASKAKADAFLEQQTKLARLQAEELSHELGLRHWSLWVRHASGMLKLALELSVALLLLALVAGVALVVWDAAHSEGLIIESFSVPPDMAARGVTGQVVASQMLDRLTAMQDATKSYRPARSYANNWGSDLKVEIPETGVSVAEVERFLTNWLGHDTRISGEVYRTASGVAVTARSGSDTGATFTGAESDLEALLQRAAEHIYSRTQPYRYANYLDRNRDPVGLAERLARAGAIYQRLAQGPDRVERAWAYFGLAGQASFLRQRHLALAYFRKAAATAPELPVFVASQGIFERFGGNRERVTCPL
jgi:hypothetical protein